MKKLLSILLTLMLLCGVSVLDRCMSVELGAAEFGIATEYT